MEDLSVLLAALDNIKADIIKCETYIKEKVDVKSVVLLIPKEICEVEKVLCQIYNERIQDDLKETLIVLNTKKSEILESIQNILSNEYTE